jgi:Putative Flp pilus-assembly TadE/G-like
MQRLEIELSNRKGFTLILGVLLITVILGTAAFAVDAGHENLNRAQVHAAADAAALAGMEKYAATVDASSALAEAQLYASKFKADNAALSLQAADFALGHCSAPCSPSTFVAGAPDSVAKATIRDTTHYAFAPVFRVFGLDIQNHLTSATSIAVGQATKEITKSTCVAPIVMPLSALFHEIGDNTKGNSDTLTASDVAKLSGTSSNPMTIPLQNGSKVNTLDSVFYQAQFPPVMTADSIQHGGQSNSASFYRNAITCTGGVAPIGVGDWLGVVNGTKANQTQAGLDNADGGTLPVTVEVVLADFIGSPTDKFGATVPGCPCLHIGYVGAFTFTADDNKSVTGYFTTLSPLAGGVVQSDTLHSAPLGQISKIRLIY